MNRRLCILLAIGVAALAVGLVGVVDRLRFGLLHVGYGTPVPWALWVVFWGLSVATAIWPTHRW